MRRWQSHKVVEADPITAFQNTITVKTVTTGDGMDAYTHEVPEKFFARGTPEIGDYLVRYEDGYLSWSPKKAFEEGYTLMDAIPWQIGVSYGARSFVITKEEIEDSLTLDCFLERMHDLGICADKGQKTMQGHDLTVRATGLATATGAVLQPDGTIGRVDVDPEKVRAMGRTSTVDDVTLPAEGEAGPFDVSHELTVIGRQRRTIDRLQESFAIMAAALLLIRDWRMPYKGFGFENGSNGERDYIRQIASRALDQSGG